MTVKLFQKGTYELKDTKEIVKLYESAAGIFWYWKTITTTTDKL